jgi:hypothetical protein
MEEEEDPIRPPRDEGGEGGSALPGGGLQRNRPFPWAAVSIPGGLLVLGALVVGVLALRVNRGLRALDLAAASYERMCRWAGLVKLLPPGEQTPYEISDQIGESLAGRRAQTTTITTAYVRERFSPHPLSGDEMAGVLQTWKQLRWALWGFPWQQLRGKIQALWQQGRERIADLVRDRTPELP